ncbi:helix-turn-helix domain-containing protein [Elusimicrobiota bacterium]
MRDLAKVIGKHVNKYRTEIGMTQEELAEKCELHPTYIAKIEGGKQMCSLKALDRLAEAMRVPLHFLVGHVPETRKKYSYPANDLEKIINKCSEPEKEFICEVAKSFLKKKKRKKRKKSK